MKILIAEDSIVCRTILQAALVKWGYEVVCVTNGTEALAALRRKDAPPLAILDVEMPGMNGTEVCQVLRKTPRPTPTYIILLTANADKPAAVAGLAGLQPDDGLNVTGFEGEDFLVVGDRCVALLRRSAFALFKAAADPT